MSNSEIYLVVEENLIAVRELFTLSESNQINNGNCQCNFCKVCRALGQENAIIRDALPLLKLLLKTGERFGQWDVKLLQELMENEYETTSD